MSTLRSAFKPGLCVQHCQTLAEGEVIERPVGYPSDNGVIVYVRWNDGERIGLPKHLLRPEPFR